MNATPKPRIALWFRYGPAEHTDLFPAIPAVIEQLAQHAEVHYYGFKSDRAVPDRIARNAVVHDLPFHINRGSEKDKLRKTLLWYLLIPCIGLRCRLNGTRAVFIDESLPLMPLLARVFFGRNVACAVADFFLSVYADRSWLIRRCAGWIQACDRFAWRRVACIFTRTKTAQRWLTEQGVPADRVHPVYDPCDFDIYHPADRAEARAQLELPADAVILVHHGILHPNKGNDRILRALAAERERFPKLIYLLIGDGPDMARLRALADELQLTDRVRFTGWLKTLPEVNHALNAGDIGLVMRVGQPTDDFHLTGALVHSMACGLPVLAARLAGIAEVVEEDKNGLLFDARDLADFPDQLERLYHDAALRQRLGNQALADAHTHFDIRRTTEEIVTPLLKLLEERPTSNAQR